MAAEWGGLITPPLLFYFTSRNSRQISTVHYEVETTEQIWLSTRQHHENRGFHYAW
jgi:hypothetical protein